jgi:4-hydroxy-4-methyl-2-oxoglutarate aldolase
MSNRGRAPDRPVAISEDVLRALATIDSPTVANAIEQFNVRDRVEGYASSELRCEFADRPPMVGYAVTCTAETSPRGEDHPAGWGALLDAIHTATAPVVVVIGWRGSDRLLGCVVGDMVATALARLGVVGIVTDSCIRDRSGIQRRAPDLHVFDRGSVVSHGRTQLVGISEPTVVGGLRVEPGALLHGDESGLVEIPREIARFLPHAARQIHDSEHEYFVALARDGVEFSDVRERLAPHE